MAIQMKLRQKYLRPGKPKFGGKKRTQGNSGGTGKAARCKRRGIVVSSSNSPEQYGQWHRAMTMAKAEG